MTTYLLVENKTTVLLGPMEWKPRFIQSELDDLEVSFIVPPAEQGYINIGGSTNLEIFPVTGLEHPPIDWTYQYYSGPTWSFENNEATGFYTVHDQPLEYVKSNLKKIAAQERFRRENLGTTLEVNGATYSLTTDRALRGQYTDLLNTIGTATVNWKFPEGFLQVNQALAQQMVSAVSAYVQSQFDWEAGIDAEINSASDVAILKNITIVPPVESPSLG